MLLHCGLLLLFLNCVRTTEYVYDYNLENSVTEYDQKFSYWPSVHNAANLMRLRKREAQGPGSVLQEGGGVAKVEKTVVPTQELKPDPKSDLQSQSASQLHSGLPTPPPSPPAPVAHSASQASPKSPSQSQAAPESSNNGKPKNEEIPVNSSVNMPSAAGTILAKNKIVTNSTASKPDLDFNVSKPGVMMRGVIVFGGFLLLALAYLIFYRTKNGKNDASRAHSNIDANQFRYGMLQSEDKRDNMECSRVPLTLESDDEDDEDLEIFNLEQKKKSLSYVNLQTNDEDIVFPNSKDSRDDKDNLLLDIESGGSDTLINWSNNGNKSIL